MEGGRNLRMVLRHSMNAGSVVGVLNLYLLQNNLFDFLHSQMEETIFEREYLHLDASDHAKATKNLTTTRLIPSTVLFKPVALSGLLRNNGYI